MDIKIVDKRENKLFDRTEIDFEVQHDKKPTPARLDVRDQLAARLGVESKLVSVISFKSKLGSWLTKGRANAYKNEEALLKGEPKYVQKRHKSAAPVEEKPAEPAKTEV